MGTDIQIALIGAGFIGRVHGLAVQAVNRIFAEGPRADPAILVDKNRGLAERQAAQLGFNEWSDDWHAAIGKADAIIIAAPSDQHRAVALAAIAAGKHVLCEKPVGRSVAEAEEIAAAAAKAKITNGVGFTYVRAPLVRHAADIVRSGEIGAPVTFRGWHAEDYLADPDAPFSWRLDAGLAGRCGALGDLGWHIVSIARQLCGPVNSLTGLAETRYRTRRDGPPGSPARQVENEDWAAMLLHFSSGAVGNIEASRIAHGRKMDIGFELICEGGSIAFHGERTNELRLYRHGAPAGQQGFQTIRIDAAHPHYGAFLPAPAHGLGFIDLKTIELHEFLMAIVEERNLDPDLDEACRIGRICEAVLDSSASGTRIIQPEVRPLHHPPKESAAS